MYIFVILIVLLVTSTQAYLGGLKPSPLRRLTQLGLTTADFKNGMTLEIDGVPMKLLEFLHVKPGKGSAFVRSKIKN